MSPVIVKEALPPIETIAAEYRELGIELQKSGNGFKTLCPFPEHLDSKPSFFIYPDGGYHCFGCGVHGSLEDIYDFFDKDFRYHMSRIDLTIITNSVIDFMPQLRKNLEKRLRLAVEGTSNSSKIYDIFDQFWIDLGFMTFTSRLQMAMVIKRKFYALLNKLEEKHA